MADPVGDGKTEIAIGDEGGKVIMRFPKPIAWCALDPQNAFQIGEAIARAAHVARFGTQPPADGSYLAQQIRSRVTDETRDRMVTRVSVMLQSLRDQNKSNGQIALQVVDTIFAEVA